jgi:hypothetical protein
MTVTILSTMNEHTRVLSPLYHPYSMAPLHSDSIEYQFVLVNVQNNVMSSESRLFKITVITLC